MQKIKLLTDSACDIPEKDRQELDIDIMLIPVTVDGQGYYERKDFTPRQFYDIISKAKTIPTTAHITHLQFEEKYTACWEEGVTDLIHVTINSQGSNMFEAAGLAKNSFYDEHPEAKEQMRITIIDSGTYSLGYGYPIMQAARMVKEGAHADTVIAYLNDWFSRVEVYASTFTLDQLKKSGRIKGGAAFVGEMLGIRPVVSFINGESNIVDKVRGNKSVVPRLVKFLTDRENPKDDYLVAIGRMDSENENLIAQCKKATKRDPAAIIEIGAAITINIGPNTVAVVYLGDKKRG
ncbi:DegV family protein [Zongyangia hominis]|uniref:DegV family protein n=1 Tax=Zongyangia hominis TaxID=2763677 RepID=A0A926EFU6_9FIRM|nr:DegV family protein [Zongyangia hominis]MBC8571389.1 DegV family protein [Zongyangia hominis]